LRAFYSKDFALSSGNPRYEADVHAEIHGVVAAPLVDDAIGLKRYGQQTDSA